MPFTLQFVLVLADAVVLVAALVAFNRSGRGGKLIVVFAILTALLAVYAGLLLFTYKIDRATNEIVSSVPGQFCLRIQESDPLAAPFLQRLSFESPLHTAYVAPALTLPCMGDSGPARSPEHWLAVYSLFVFGRAPLPDFLHDANYSVAITAPLRLSVLSNTLLLVTLGLFLPLYRESRRSARSRGRP